MILLTYIASGNVGWVHLIASIIALVLGTISLALTKGTALHKKIGYGYAVSMLILLITAFMLYNLFGRWGIFHWAAVVSSLTLAAGMLPILMRSKNYLAHHLSFMYWSVMGLYGAFAAEIMVRIPRIIVEHGLPNKTFFIMTSIGVALVMGIAGFCFSKLSNKWQTQFSLNKPTKNLNHN